MSILIYHVTTADFMNHCTAQFWVHSLQKCTWTTCFPACSPGSCCTATSQHWLTCTMMKVAVNKPFYDWTSSAITSQSSESGPTCPDSTSIYHYSYVHELKAHSFTQISWFWASIISVQSLWHITLQRWDCLARWMLFFLLFEQFYQVIFSSFNAILSEKSFYHWNFRNQTFSATD